MKMLLLSLLTVFTLSHFAIQSDIPRNSSPALRFPPAKPNPPTLLVPSLPPPRETLAKGVIYIERAQTLPVDIEMGGVRTRGKVYAVDVRVGLGTTSETTVHLRFMHNFQGELAVLQKLDALLRKAEKSALPVTFIGIRANDRRVFSRVEAGEEIVDLLAP